MLHPEFLRAPGTRAPACSALFAVLAAALVPLAPGTAHADDGRSLDGDCGQRAIAGAVQVLDQPLVTRLHLRRSGAAPDRTGA